MKKIYFFALFVVSCVCTTAQVIIQSADLPTGGDVLNQDAATLLSDPDLTQTGANQTWYFGPDIIQPQNTTNTTNCVDVAQTPLVYQIFFNNPFDPDHNSDYGVGVDSFAVATLSFEDVYQYYKNSGGVFSITGMGASINGVPLASQMNDTDVIYDVPVEFENTGESFSALAFEIPTFGSYGTDQHRTYAVDGWGTLVLYEDSYDVLRVRSVINATDTIYAEAFGFGFSFPRPESVEYKWLSPDYNVPVLEIITTGGTISSVLTRQMPVSVNEVNNLNVKVFPNPAAQFLQINSAVSGNGNIQIFNAAGQLVIEATNSLNTRIDISELPNGNYTIVLKQGENVMSKVFVKM
jgi:hypothetical protein